jgi:hypothetical protein
MNADKSTDGRLESTSGHGGFKSLSHRRSSAFIGGSNVPHRRFYRAEVEAAAIAAVVAGRGGVADGFQAAAALRTWLLFRDLNDDTLSAARSEFGEHEWHPPSAPADEAEFPFMLSRTMLILCCQVPPGRIAVIFCRQPLDKLRGCRYA